MRAGKSGVFTIRSCLLVVVLVLILFVGGQLVLFYFLGGVSSPRHRCAVCPAVSCTDVLRPVGWTPDEVDQMKQMSDEEAVEYLIQNTAPWEATIANGVQKCPPLTGVPEGPILKVFVFEHYWDTYKYGASGGATMGELRNFRDILVALQQMCCDVIFIGSLNETDPSDAEHVLQAGMWADVIITDQYSFAKLPPPLSTPEMKCKWRLIDVWGTPPHQNYLKLDLHQFLVPFEAMRSNGYLGFMLPTPPTNLMKKRQGLLWGKEAKYFIRDHAMINRIAERVPLFATARKGARFRSENVTNLGIVSQEVRNQLLRESMFLIGFGDPAFGYTPWEAVNQGCPVLMKKYPSERRLYHNPTIPLRSQHTLAAEAIGSPIVQEVTWNPKRVMQAIEEVMSMNDGMGMTEGFRDPKHRPLEYVTRLDGILRRDFCQERLNRIQEELMKVELEKQRKLLRKQEKEKATNRKRPSKDMIEEE